MIHIERPNEINLSQVVKNQIMNVPSDGEIKQNGLIGIIRGQTERKCGGGSTATPGGSPFHHGGVNRTSYRHGIGQERACGTGCAPIPLVTAINQAHDSPRRTQHKSGEFDTKILLSYCPKTLNSYTNKQEIVKIANHSRPAKKKCEKLLASRPRPQQTRQWRLFTSVVQSLACRWHRWRIVFNCGCQNTHRA